MTHSNSEKPWYQVAFGELYPKVYAHRDDTSAEKEVGFVTGITQAQVSDSILDLGCGGGRHLRALQKLKFRPVGMDLSPFLLREHRRASDSPLVRGDLRALPFKNSSFSIVLSFFSSFGYFDSDEEDQGAIGEVGRVLAPKGRYVLDYLDSGAVISGLVPRSERTREGMKIIEERRIENQRVKKRLTAIREDTGETMTWEESVRLYSASDLEAMIRRAGMKVIDRFGALDGTPLGEGSRCVLLSEQAP